MSSEGGRDVSVLRPRIHITHDVLRTLHATFPHSTHNFMQNKMIWTGKTCKIRWFERIKYSKNLLQMWFMVKIQSESWKWPVGKILFSNWKIFISQLRNYFFPVGLFLSLFLDVFLFLFGFYLFIYTQYENLGTGKNIWQTTLGEFPDAARCLSRLTSLKHVLMPFCLKNNS